MDLSANSLFEGASLAELVSMCAAELADQQFEKAYYSHVEAE